jgi:hypothetical protein
MLLDDVGEPDAQAVKERSDKVFSCDFDGGAGYRAWPLFSNLDHGGVEHQHARYDSTTQCPSRAEQKRLVVTA